jgi:uncharacterized protein (TIGR02391 family)
MGKLSDFLPSPESFSDLEPEELGSVLLHVLSSNGGDRINPYNFVHFLFDGSQRQYDPKFKPVITSAIEEAWTWLLREGLIAERFVAAGPREFCVTRRGRSLRTSQDIEVYRKASLLPKHLLHQRIVGKVWTTFLRGDHDTAVFQAFKEVEVAVRNACQYPPDKYGPDMMRKAFGESGPLSDSSAPKAERDALSNLFAGAIGCYKNPHSHRHVILSAEEAAEMIVFASHLLRIVEARASAPTYEA